MSIFKKIYQLKIKIQQFLKHKIVAMSNANIKFANGVKIDWGTNIDINGNKLELGENVYLRSLKKGYHAGMPFGTTILMDKEGAECKIGKNSRINGTYIHAQCKIEIGENTLIASGTNILDTNGHETLSLNRTIGRDKAAPIFIGNNVWIGLNATILKGTTIGDNSIVTAGSVVKGKYPDNALIQGNPAVVVKILEFPKA